MVEIATEWKHERIQWRWSEWEWLLIIRCIFRVQCFISFFYYIFQGFLDLEYSSNNSCLKRDNYLNIIGFVMWWSLSNHLHQQSILLEQVHTCSLGHRAFLGTMVWKTVSLVLCSVNQHHNSFCSWTDIQLASQKVVSSRGFHIWGWHDFF